MKKFCFIFMVASLLFFTISCDNDDIARDARPPEFDELILNPSTVFPSDSVKATVTYKNNNCGKKIYKSKYVLKIYGNTSSGQYTKTIDWEVIDPTKSEPTCKFVAPDESGYYTVMFSAPRIEASTNFSNGSPVSTANSVSAVLYVKSKE